MALRFIVGYSGRGQTWTKTGIWTTLDIMSHRVYYEHVLFG